MNLQLSESPIEASDETACVTIKILSVRFGYSIQWNSQMEAILLVSHNRVQVLDPPQRTCMKVSFSIQRRKDDHDEPTSRRLQ